MTINLLLVFLLQAEDDLTGHNTLVRVLEMQVRVDRERSGVLEKMSRDFLVINHVLHMVSGLIDAQEGETVEDTRVDFLAAVGDDANNNLFPCVRSPGLGVLPSAEMGDVAHHSV
jgi:hypothetical protein